jgi:hypothetical protein
MRKGDKRLERGLTRRIPMNCCVQFQQCVERSGSLGVARDKSSVVAGEAKDRTQLADVCGGGKQRDCFHFGRVGPYAVGRDDVTEVFARVDRKGAFFGVGLEASVVKCLEDALQVDTVVLKGFAVDQEIIQVHPRETAEGRAQTVVHDALKGGWGPLKAKGHLGVFEVPNGGGKRRIRDVGLTNRDLVKAGLEVDDGEDGGIAQTVENIVRPGDQVRVT